MADEIVLIVEDDETITLGSDDLELVEIAAGDPGPPGPAAWLPAVAWASGVQYSSLQPAALVTFGGETFVCAVSHISALAFATDLGAGRWIKLAAKGDPGIKGDQGLQGTTGPQGLQGTSGLQGLMGTSGLQGLMGTSGLQGLMGTSGIQGIQGTSGIQGLQGTSGLQGLTGPAAWQAVSPWTTATVYTANDPKSVVTFGGETYVCATSHTSGTFATDLLAAKWNKIAAKGANGTNGGQHPGYVAGRYYSIHGSHFGAVGGANQTVNIIRFQLFVAEADITVDQLAASTSTNGSTGLCAFAIYAADATTKLPTGNPLASTSFVSMGGFGNFSAALGSSVVVPAGTAVWVAFVAKTAAASLMGFNTQPYALERLIGHATLSSLWNPSNAQVGTHLTFARDVGTLGWPDMTSQSPTYADNNSVNPPVIFARAA